MKMKTEKGKCYLKCVCRSSPYSIQAIVSVKTLPPCAWLSWWWTRRPWLGRRRIRSLRDWITQSGAHYTGSTAGAHAHAYAHAHTHTHTHTQKQRNPRQMKNRSITLPMGWEALRQSRDCSQEVKRLWQLWCNVSVTQKPQGISVTTPLMPLVENTSLRWPQWITALLTTVLHSFHL